MAEGRWGGLIGDAPDRVCSAPYTMRHPDQCHATALASAAYSGTPTAATSGARKAHKNWEGITTEILKSEKEITSSEDPNAGGDTAVNSFFRQLYDGADEDTKRAMLKSYQESGGTTLSTNWSEVGKGHVEVKPPTGSEWKKWGA